ncbi:MAG: GHKL domain-containing protein [Gammaproteobacteria bacterium]|nr:GHKL domain-containing protein [Gammaproteobacteria bacterium]
MIERTEYRYMNNRDNLKELYSTVNQQSGEQFIGEQLENAFQLFNQLSEKLSRSYSELEGHVSRLTVELTESRNERLTELAEKKVLAIKLEGLLDALPAGVVVLDSDNNVTQTNPIARLMLMNKTGEDCLINKKWDYVARESLLINGDEVQLRNGDWQGRYINISIRPLVEGSIKAGSGKIILLSDISETRCLQNELNRQKRLSSLGEMIASLAHQIRTPLASALLYISALNHPKNNTEERISFAKKARDRLYHLERMVNDMLLFARGDLSESEYLNAYDFMHKLKNIIHEDSRTKNITININENLRGFRIQANHDALLSAVQNIIDNALVACGELNNCVDSNNVTEISINAYINDCKQFQLSFKDNGCGMSEQIRDRVLEPFFTTHTSGTGLGLSVVNATVNRYCGELEVVSKEGVGSEFIMKFTGVHNTGVLPSNLSATNNKNIMNASQGDTFHQTKDKQEIVI